MTKPAIRFQGFSSAWEQRKLGDITSKIGSGKTPLGGAEAYVEAGIPLIRSQNVHDDTVDLSDVVFIDDETNKSMENSVVSTDDVLLNITGASIGRSAVYKGTVPANVNQHVCIIRPVSGYYPDFVQLHISSANGQKQIDSSQAGGAREGLNFQQIGKFEFAFPSYEEQVKIGNYIRGLDTIIALHQRKCDDLQEVKKYMLQKLFPQNGARIPEIRFAGFTGEWVQRKLGDIATSFDYGLNAAAKEYDGINRYIRITDIDDDSHNFISDGITSPDTDLSKADDYKVAKGDILFARTGASVGKSYIYKPSDGLMYFAGFLIRARVKQEYDAQFVFQNTLTEAYSRYIAVTSQRSGQPGVNAQEYAEYEIMCPTREEQAKIGEHLAKLDNLITLHQRKADDLQAVKKYMLQNIFPKSRF